MRKTPTKVVEKGNNDNLVSSVKKAAAILMTALGIAVATSQDTNAQMFEGIDTKKMLAETDAEDKKLDNENAQKRKTIVVKKTNLTKTQKELEDEKDSNEAKRAEIARMKGEKGE